MPFTITLRHILVAEATPSVADAALADDLTDPHQEHGTGGHRADDEHIKENGDTEHLNIEQFAGNDAWASQIHLHCVAGEECRLHKSE